MVATGQNRKINHSAGLGFGLGWPRVRHRVRVRVRVRVEEFEFEGLVVVVQALEGGTRGASVQCELQQFFLARKPRVWR